MPTCSHTLTCTGPLEKSLGVAAEDVRMHASAPAHMLACLPPHMLTRMHRCIHACMHACIQSSTDGWSHGRKHRCMNPRTHGCTRLAGGRTAEQMERLKGLQAVCYTNTHTHGSRYVRHGIPDAQMWAGSCFVVCVGMPACCNAAILGMGAGCTCKDTLQPCRCRWRSFDLVTNAGGSHMCARVHRHRCPHVRAHVPGCVFQNVDWCMHRSVYGPT